MQLHWEVIPDGGAYNRVPGRAWGISILTRCSWLQCHEFRWNAKPQQQHTATFIQSLHNHSPVS